MWLKSKLKEWEIFEREWKEKKSAVQSLLVAHGMPERKTYKQAAASFNLDYMGVKPLWVNIHNPQKVD